MKRPTMEDVAREAGVSRALVSLVFRGVGYVSDQRRVAVLEAADRLGYQLDAVARRLAAHKSQLIGVVMSDLSNPVFAELIEEMQAIADERNYRLLFGAASLKPAHELAAIETLLEFRPDGLVLMGTVQSRTAIERFSSHTPVTLFGRVIRHASVDCVAPDGARGAELAVDHLVSLGHSRIAHLDGGRGAGASSRRTGYQKAMQKHGLKEHSVVISGDYSEAAGFAAVEQLERRGMPTAVFAANDLMAVGLSDGFRKRGYDVPSDVSLVGFDDTRLARMESFSLTSISATRQHVGVSIMQTLLERIDGVRSDAVVRVYEPELVVRRSSAPPREVVESRAPGTAREAG